MIRQTRLSTNWRYPIKKIEMTIFAISQSEMTINEIKLFRLKDVTHFICPFHPEDRDHHFKNPIEVIHHIPNCMKLTLKGSDKKAKKICDCWHVCERNPTHVFDIDFYNIHMKLHKQCKEFAEK